MIRAERHENEKQLRMSQLDLKRCIKNSKGLLKVSFLRQKKGIMANQNHNDLVWQKVSLHPT